MPVNGLLVRRGRDFVIKRIERTHVGDQVGQALLRRDAGAEQAQDETRQCRGVAADAHRGRRDLVLDLGEGRRADAREGPALLDQLRVLALLADGKLQALAHRLVERRDLAVGFLGELLEAGDAGALIQLREIGQCLLDRVALAADRVALAAALGLIDRGEQGRRARGDAGAVRGELQRRRDLRQVAVGNAVEQRADFAERGPADHADDHGAGGNAAEGEEKLAADAHCTAADPIGHHCRISVVRAGIRRACRRAHAPARGRVRAAWRRRRHGGSCPPTIRRRPAPRASRSP
jgi:hypothetical protein